MKKIILIYLLFSIAAIHSNAQTKDYKVVFDLTSRDSLDHKSVMRWVNEIALAEPDARLEMVMYGQGVNMVVKGRSTVEDIITKLVSNKNVSFKVCSVAIKNQHIDKDQLIPGVEIVPDGIYEIISKQHEGWGYIKAVH